MNKIPFLLFILVFVKSLTAQDFTKAIHTEYNIAEANIILHQNNLYFSTKTSPSAGTEKTDIYSFTKNGTFRFRTTISLGASTNAAKVFATTDGKVAVAGYVIPDCHVGNYRMPFLVKLDTNGQTLFAQTYTNSALNGQKTRDACQLNNGDYFIICESALFKTNSAGAYVSAATALDSVFAITTQNNGVGIIVNALGDTNFFPSSVRNYFYSSNLNYLNDKPSANRYKKILLHGGRYFAITQQGFIESTDTAFMVLANTINSQNFNAGSLVKDFSISNDTLFAVIQQTNNTGSDILALDTNLSLLAIHQSSAPYHKAENIHVNQGRAYLNLNHLPPGNIPNISLVSFRTDTIYRLKHNIALTKVMIDDAFQVNTYTQGTMPLVDLKFKAKVKNLGSTTINSFFLTADRGSFAGDACYRKFIHQQFSNLNIAPGDSATVITDTVVALLQQPHSLNSTHIGNLCFVASAPNEENDEILINNVHCPNLSLSPTGLTESATHFSEPLFFPNPANSVITFKNIPQDAEISIINYTGKVCKTTHGSSELNVSDLQDGIYFLGLKTSQKTINLKLLIQK